MSMEDLKDFFRQIVIPHLKEYKYIQNEALLKQLLYKIFKVAEFRKSHYDFNVTCNSDSDIQTFKMTLNTFDNTDIKIEFKFDSCLGISILKCVGTINK